MPTKELGLEMVKAWTSMSRRMASLEGVFLKGDPESGVRACGPSFVLSFI